ncbi:ATP-grasp domain-containing protein [Candidatus Shapirobacteria bacterium]|nr:ATP-grasp domain-containing protein [Candidatus Shapirobacteria bacterium]
MNKKIIAFTMSLKQSQFEVDRLVTEAKKLGVPVLKALYREMTFDLNNQNPKVYVQGEEVTAENTLGMWFRVAGTVSGKYTEGRNLAIRLLQPKGVLCANHDGYLNWARMGKIAQHGVFIEKEIPVVPTRIFYTKDQITNYELLMTNFFGWEYPTIAKHEKGYQGKSVKKFDNGEQVIKFVKKIHEKNVGMFLWQKYLPTKWDLRVIVLGGEAIGAMKRMAVGKEFRSNYSLGGAVDVWNLSEADRMLAEKVAKVCGLDYCGVDIMKDEQGNSYILEVNRQCQFKGFEESTGINVAKAVVEMFLNKNSLPAGRQAKSKLQTLK